MISRSIKYHKISSHVTTFKGMYLPEWIIAYLSELTKTSLNFSFTFFSGREEREKFWWKQMFSTALFCQFYISFFSSFSHRPFLYIFHVQSIFIGINGRKIEAQPKNKKKMFYVYWKIQKCPWRSCSNSCSDKKILEKIDYFLLENWEMNLKKRVLWENL